MVKIFLHYLLLIFITLSPVLSGASGTDKTRILIWGDSLSSAYGMPVDEGWVALLQDTLAERVEVVNASVSGETTGGGRSRLPSALELHRPEIVIIELGGNDALRGFRPEHIRANLKSMIEQSKAAGARVLLLGIRMPPNYGEAYNREIETVYADLARHYEVPLVPFLLDGIADDFDLMQSDGIHPTAKAQPLILAHVLPVLKGLLPN
jgi:acyl-CoA thioesterase I